MSKGLLLRPMTKYFRQIMIVLWVAFLVSASSSQAQSTYFPLNNTGLWDTLPPSALGWCPARIDSLYALLDSNDTKAFILLKDGKIVLEKYFAGHSPNTLWRWASAGKTVTATLVVVHGLRLLLVMLIR